MLRSLLLPKYVSRKQKGFHNLLQSTLESQYYSEAEMKLLQEKKLQALIRHAYEQVPAYKKSFNDRGLNPTNLKCVEDLGKLPVLNKQDITRHGDQYMASGAKGPLFTRRTSGSTGTPYKVIFDERAAHIESALFYRFLFSMGYDWGDQLVRLWGAPIVDSGKRKNLRKVISDKIWNNISFDTYNLDNNTIERILALLQGKSDRILRGYTSAVYTIALEMIRAGVKVKIKGVSTTAEKLFQYQRDVIRKAFDQEVYDQYGCGESNSIAFECEAHNGLHVASEHIIVELLNEHDEVVGPGESGRVVLTDLDNYAMPLIRYDNKDLATWSSDICACGRSLPILKDIDGRAYEMLTVPGGKKIHGGFFDEIYIEMGFGDRYSIDDLRIVQEDIYNYSLEFVMMGKLTEQDVMALRSKYRQYLGDVNVKIKYVEKIPVNKSGKRMFVIPYA